jgi:hypothetical protein
LHANSLQLIHQLEHLPLPADELRPSLTDTSIVVGHLAQRVDLLGRRRNVLRPTLSTIREDRAFMQFAASTAAVGLTALSTEGVQRPWQERLASEAILEQSLECLLGFGEPGAGRAELLVHGLRPVESVYYYVLTPTDTLRVSEHAKKK